LISNYERETRSNYCLILFQSVKILPEPLPPPSFCSLPAM
jgi:hypothetical protein